MKEAGLETIPAILVEGNNDEIALVEPQTLRQAHLISVITVYYHIIRILIPYIVCGKNVTPESGQAKLRTDKDFSISSHCC
ncbi:MAG: hypothetical protein KKF01_05325, partial [Proteobacteria bacterium]|nr:hypothetical protein [Pseudomonadota bacterium]